MQKLPVCIILHVKTFSLCFDTEVSHVKSQIIVCHRLLLGCSFLQHCHSEQTDMTDWTIVLLQVSLWARTHNLNYKDEHTLFRPELWMYWHFYRNLGRPALSHLTAICGVKVCVCLHTTLVTWLLMQNVLGYAIYCQRCQSWPHAVWTPETGL